MLIETNRPCRKVLPLLLLNTFLYLHDVWLHWTFYTIFFSFFFFWTVVSSVFKQTKYCFNILTLCFHDCTSQMSRTSPPPFKRGFKLSQVRCGKGKKIIRTLLWVLAVWVMLEELCPALLIEPFYHAVTTSLACGAFSFRHTWNLDVS